MQAGTGERPKLMVSRTLSPRLGVSLHPFPSDRSAPQAISSTGNLRWLQVLDLNLFPITGLELPPTASFRRPCGRMSHQP